MDFDMQRQIAIDLHISITQELFMSIRDLPGDLWKDLFLNIHWGVKDEMRRSAWVDESLDRVNQLFDIFIVHSFFFVEICDLFFFLLFDKLQLFFACVFLLVW